MDGARSADVWRDRALALVGVVGLAALAASLVLRRDPDPLDQWAAAVLVGFVVPTALGRAPLPRRLAALLVAMLILAQVEGLPRSAVTGLIGLVWWNTLAELRAAGRDAPPGAAPTA